MQTAFRILIIGPSWVGDMVMAQGLFQLLKQQPNTIIDVLAPAWTHPLLARMPEVNDALSLPFQHGEFKLLQRWKFAQTLKSRKYQQAIILPNSWKSALIPFALNIPKRTGWLGEARWGLLNDVRYLNKKRLPLMIERFTSLGLPKNIPLPQSSFTPALSISSSERDIAIAKYQLNIQKPILILCPGAEFGTSKRWPAEYFAQVANEKLKQDWQIWILGSVKDQTVAEVIQQHTKNACYNLTGKTSLAEAIDLISLATIVISNDSGLMHIAAALQRKLIAIYGSTDAHFTPPLTNKAQILSINLTCRPCFQRECPLQHHRCMRDLKPNVVIQAIQNACTDC